MKKSASLAAAQAEYYAKHNIVVKTKKVEIVEEIKRIIPPCTIKEFGIYMACGNKAKVIEIEDIVVVKNILSYYNSVLNFIIKPDIFSQPVNVKDYIEKNKCHEGVCYCARMLFGVDICKKDWILKRLSYQIGFKDYWLPIPKELWTSKELVYSISRRVEILTDILNEMQ